MLTIKIGRAETVSNLSLEINGQKKAEGKQNSVPKTVSREHACIEIDDKGRMLIRNLNIDNYTYINGRAVEVKRLKHGDKIELSQAHFKLDWSVLDKAIPRMADIRPLAQVWEDYQDAKMALTIKERRFGNIRAGVGLITMSGMLIGMILGRDGSAAPLIVFAYVLAIVLGIICFVIAHNNSAKIPNLQQELTDELYHTYVCPNCGHFLGMQPYTVIRQNECCPYCRAKYIK